MLISIDWIKDFVNVPELDSKTISEKFTMATAEVEKVDVSGLFWEQIRVVEITSIEAHPEADKLNLVTFKASDEESFRVVCGASNVRIGLKTPFAPIGTTLPVGFTLEPKKIRGILSEGMLCSEEELGLKDKSSGIMELPEDAPLGESLLNYFNEAKDVVLDIDNKSLTHRPDLWGHYGIAREFGAIFGESLKDSFDDSWKQKILSKISGGNSPIKIKVDSDSSCLGYYGLSIDNVDIKESPKHIKRRLESVGLRPINNIVDISNYVMLELGIPLHIFDREKISGESVNIKRAQDGESFVTLDEVERKLKVEDTIISDSSETLVLAGVMGGLSSGVTEATKSIFIEVANWKASEVRQTSTRLGLRTDSSQRYEKSLDTNLLERTLLRTVELVLDSCSNSKIVGSIEKEGLVFQKENLVLNTSASYISKVLGINIDFERVVSILTSLDFKISSKNKDELEIIVPTYRSTKDIDCVADIVEEIGRIVGYDNISPSSPRVDVSPVGLTCSQKLHRDIKNFLSFHSNSYEVLTYPMIGEKLLEKAHWNTDNNSLKLVNSLSKDADRMRDSLVPSLLESLAKNQKNSNEFRLFEIGRTYSDDKNNFSKEGNVLGILFYSKDKNVFMDLVNNVSRLMTSINLPGDFSPKHPKFKNNILDESWDGVHPFEFYNIRIMGKMNGVITSIHPLLLRSFKIKGNASLCLIDLSSFEARPLKDRVKYTPLPVYPESSFDCTVVADKGVAVRDIVDCLKKIKIKELISTKVVDIFEEFSESQKTITLKSTFFDSTKTLDGDFIAMCSEKIVATLKESGFNLKV